MNGKRLYQQVRDQHAPSTEQKGQSIVLIALALIAVVAFMGIALDVGFIFARGSQLQAAIDSAALAGVTELSGWTQNGPGNPGLEAAARTKSAQFLNANGMPLSVTLSINDPGGIFVEQTSLGAIQYSVTATWPVETFFLKAIGFNERISLSRSATAAVFSLAEIYASRRIEDGIISTSNQSVFGWDICTSFGDPYSPLNSVWQPGPYYYQYRIYIPPDYPYDRVRVEILDPDSINNQSNGPFTISRTDAAIAAGLPAQFNASCPNSDTRDSCLIDTGELALVDSGVLQIDQINPYFFWRIDENRGTGVSGQCGEPSGGYDATRNTLTEYKLYYFKQNPDGTVIREEMAHYNGQVGDGARDSGGHNTDMMWVTPGGPRATDNVPANSGSFEIDLTAYPDIVVDQTTGARYINLEVGARDGASENGFEFWAGPPNYTNVPDEANDRNRYVLNNPGSHSSEGVTVLASGVLPLNSNMDREVDIPLLFLGPEFAGEEITISLFDPDAGAQGPITFYFDSISRDDWELVFDDAPNPDPDGQTRNCEIGGSPSCNNQWIAPPYKITVPGLLENCDYGNPDENCIPFYGGRLTAHYRAGGGDTYVWQISVKGLPYLVR